MFCTHRGGWGGVGHVITFNVNLRRKDMLVCGCGVGWGGACNNVHVNLRRKDMLLCGYCKFSGTFHSWVMPRYVSSLELSTHTSC